MRFATVSGILCHTRRVTTVRAKLINGWENLKASLWFVPTLMVLAAMILSVVLVEIDIQLAQGGSRLVPWLFGGSADPARTVLGVSAGTLITVVSITFSITIVAFQQTSTQFSPRVLRTFTSDRGNQTVLGAYIATFVYALLILRHIRNPEGGEAGFVPALSITVALLLTVVCLGLLIYFIHHITQLLQVAVILGRIHEELICELDEIFPFALGAPVTDESPFADSDPDTGGDRTLLRSTTGGFLRIIDGDTLFAASDGRTPWLRVLPQVGEFVPYGAVLAEMPPSASLTDEQMQQLRAAFVLDVERTINQDALFGFRQMADIALKALSPAINDPTTAEYSLSRMGDALGRLALLPFPSSVRVAAGGKTRYIFHAPTWEEFVDAAFAQIRRQAQNDVHVTGHMLRVLHKLAVCLPDGPRCAAVQHEVDEIRRVLDQGQFSPHDAAMLRQLCDAVDLALRIPVQEQVPESAATV